MAYSSGDVQRGLLGHHAPTPPNSKSTVAKTLMPLNEENASYFFCEFPQDKESQRSPRDRNHTSPPSYSCTVPKNCGIVKTIEAEIDNLTSTLREVSLQLHARPETAFEERFAHDTLTALMSSHGFSVTRHYLGMDTAWRAEFTRGDGGRVIGVNSEMDALPGMGHACGHNLIAVSGVGIALAIKAALQAHDIPGKVVLLGTPAEETGSGKAILLERGAYKDMDACLMCHPTSGPPNSVIFGRTLALQAIDVEFFGHAAHAGDAPWDGTNALDAAFMAYSGISVLRQQMRPENRIHGVMRGKESSANVIPDYAKMRWLIRAPSRVELNPLCERVKACFQAAALATGCKVEVKSDLPYYDLRQNDIMAAEFSALMEDLYGMTSRDDIRGASTDFGNVTYELPAFHPLYGIPTAAGGGNHTPAFTDAARSQTAHDATMVMTKGLALLGFRILREDAFFRDIKTAFDSSTRI